MPPTARAGRGSLIANSRYVVSLTASAGLALTLLLTVADAPAQTFQNRSLHVAKETVAGLVLLLVGALLWGRFRRSGRLLDLLALAGVIVLAGKTLVFAVLTAILTETSGGLTTWRTTGAGMLGAALLAAAALAPERFLRDRRRALVVTTLGCAAGLLALIGIADLFELPAAFNEPPDTSSELRRLSQDGGLLVADIGATILFVVAGAAFGRRAERDRDEFQLWLGIGSIIAGIAYLNYALVPSLYTDYLYAGDLFRLAAVIALGIGTVRVISAYQSAYAQAAVLDERRRVARELHDGVAQELAFISSQMHWLARHGENPAAADQIMAAVQRALDESRGAISTLSRPLGEPLDEALSRVASEVAERVGARLELDFDEDVTVAPAWEEALPRIVREAVANAVRHGHARTVTVHLRDSDGVRLRVIDDGDGFDVDEPRSAASYGLIGMRERTEALGGSFSLSSEPGAGTAVEIRLP